MRFKDQPQINKTEDFKLEWDRHKLKKTQRDIDWESLWINRSILNVSSQIQTDI
jgi:hypothetical protein